MWPFSSKNEKKKTKPSTNDDAYDPETGEINWDCPCLGDMTKGPCAEEFKAAFSCYIYSKSDPKGMDCLEKFKGMQDCFKKYPDVYKDNIFDDDDLDIKTTEKKSWWKFW